jgi:hypothetical protein
MPAEHPLPKQPVYLKLRMQPPWVFIDEIRRFVESFCACACPDAGREAQLATAVHELMQNALPSGQGDDVELHLEVDREMNRVQVAVSNRCGEAEHLALAARVDRMYAEPDALAHYLKAMDETPSSERGGLGLARVRFECQLDLAVSRLEGRVTVHACGPLHAPAIHLGGR